MLTNDLEVVRVIGQTTNRKGTPEGTMTALIVTQHEDIEQATDRSFEMFNPLADSAHATIASQVTYNMPGRTHIPLLQKNEYETQNAHEDDSSIST